MCILRSDQNSGSIFNSHLAVISRPLVILNCSDSAHLEQCQLVKQLMWLLPVRADKWRMVSLGKHHVHVPKDFGKGGGAGSWDRVIFPQFPESVYTDLGGSFSSSSGVSCLFRVCGGGAGVCRGCVSVFLFCFVFCLFLFCFPFSFFAQSQFSPTKTFCSRGKWFRSWKTLMLLLK